MAAASCTTWLCDLSPLGFTEAIPKHPLLRRAQICTFRGPTTMNEACTSAGVQLQTAFAVVLFLLSWTYLDSYLISKSWCVHFSWSGPIYLDCWDCGTTVWKSDFMPSRFVRGLIFAIITHKHPHQQIFHRLCQIVQNSSSRLKVLFPSAFEKKKGYTVTVTKQCVCVIQNFLCFISFLCTYYVCKGIS